eukprot:CAMPEP_0175046538 /NCGR_PEP_ID=MMETSP0052_2-20121109/5086_1 /TAXON_ID=51329 ORGANISM="Polytomella parva, Strain SAG 63-3" /NCGR_SAMPLE_ID=MMETSP0052_2 /ASSEMBLY_ACC=CAM_ASM_000194 /LENGTH=429 /DNA_ID=CAMNT_0016310295 /DNA_START=232 /DNA_END=1521 /DNA_ORIENTATION=+
MYVKGLTYFPSLMLSNSFRFSFTRSFRTSAVSGLQAGIVGLPNVGKSTLFNAIVENGKAEAANYPFCTIEPNTGVVSVPDPRLEMLSKISGSKKLLPATFEFVDIAGLVRGAASGQGLGNKFLANVREVDALCHVIRCFSDDNIVHVDGRVDSVADAEVVNTELALADLDQVERRLEKLRRNAYKKSAVNDPAAAEREAAELKALTEINKLLAVGRPARDALPILASDERLAVKGLCLLTMKPMLYVANVSETELASRGKGNLQVNALRQLAQKEGGNVVVVSARFEEELNQLPKEEAQEWIDQLKAETAAFNEEEKENLGYESSIPEVGGLNCLTRAAYRALGLRTYFTTGEVETRAWTYQDGMSAPQCAGIIHTDFEKGFIRAETVSFKHFIEFGGYRGAKEKGLVRQEGRDYIVQEGDVLNFKFSV